MGELSYGAGKKTYTLNGGETIRFDPGDSEFASRVVAAFQNCHKIQRECASNRFTEIDQMVSATKKMSDAIRQEIDTTFGEPVCDKACCGSSPISISDGLPVWMNFLMAVIDEIDANMPEGEKRSRIRVQQYMDKYNTKYAKYMRV